MTITAIGSGKGGTGKTLVATSIAQALAHLGERVLLCDADFGLSNAGVHLGLSETGDLAGVLDGSKALKDAVAGVTCGRAHFDILAAPSGSGALANASAAEVEALLATLVRASQYDRVLLDLGAGVDANVMTVAAHADEVLVVLSPDPASLTDAYAFAKLLLRRTTSRVPQIVVNMAANATEGRRIADALCASASAFLKATPELLGIIPFDSRVSDAVRRQAPLLTQFPQTPAATAIEAIARKMHGHAAPMAAAGLR